METIYILLIIGAAVIVTCVFFYKITKSKTTVESETMGFNAFDAMDEVFENMQQSCESIQRSTQVLNEAKKTVEINTQIELEKRKIRFS
jgi:ABC-type multidrug transport system fused ATPase/permease subunit